MVVTNFLRVRSFTSMTTYLSLRDFYFLASFGAFSSSSTFSSAPSPFSKPGWYFSTFAGATSIRNLRQSPAFLPNLHNSKGNVQTASI